MSDDLIAITGGTGFIGQHLVRRLAEQGCNIRLLVRNSKAAAYLSEFENVDYVRGDLDNNRSLDLLMEGAETVLHLASRNFAVAREEFARTNRTGTQNVVKAAQAAGVRQFVHLSSLAAREPELSGYAASKARAEEDLQRLCADRGPSWVIVRPPAVYGPGDKATLPMLQALNSPVAFLPGRAEARFSLIFVEDLVDALVGVIGDAAVSGKMIELDDGTPGGYDWPSLVRLAGEVRGKTVRPIFLPRSVMTAAAGAVELGARVTQSTPMIARGKVRELYHINWVCQNTEHQKSGAWQPKTKFAEGFRKTVSWYKDAGWI